MNKSTCEKNFNVSTAHQLIRLFRIVTLIRYTCKRADQHVAGNGLAKHFHAQHVRYNLNAHTRHQQRARVPATFTDLFRFLVNVRMHQRHVVVARNHIAERRQALLDALHHHLVRQRVANVQQFLRQSVQQARQTASASPLGRSLCWAPKGRFCCRPSCGQRCGSLLCWCEPLQHNNKTSQSARAAWHTAGYQECDRPNDVLRHENAVE